MKRYRAFLGFGLSITVLLIAVLLSFNTNTSRDQALNEFIKNMKVSGYTLSIEAVDKDILQGERKLITVNDQHRISVYIYNTDKEMEKDAGRISGDGCSYDRGLKHVSISWVDVPRFFKTDNIIVLYVGENKELIEYLTTSFGISFAGEL